MKQRSEKQPGAPRGSAGLVVLLGALLLAQAGGAQAQVVPGSESGSTGSGVTVSKVGDEKLSVEQRLERATGFVAGISNVAESVSRQLKAARSERDVVKVLCLNDKLNQIDVALSSAKERLATLNSAAERKDEDRVRHEYTVLDVLQERVKVLAEESSQCVGEETGFVGEAEVSVTIDPNLPDGFSSGGESAAPPPPPPASTATGIE